MSYTQMIIKHATMEIQDKGIEQVIGTFWVDNNGNVDADNLPSDMEIAELLKVLMRKNVVIESTGNVVDDE